MNYIIIKGKICKDLEIKETKNNIELLNFSVAVNRKFHKNETDFFNCTAWRNNAVNIEKYFNKGDEIILIGSMQSRKYEDKNGENKTIWELQVNQFEFCGYKNNTNSINTNEFEEIEEIDGELPF